MLLRLEDYGARRSIAEEDRDRAPNVKTWCAERSRNFSGTTSAPQISLADLILEASSGPRPSCFFMALWHESFLDAYASFFWFARSARDAAHKKPQPLGPLMPGDSHVRLRHCGGEAGAPLFVNAPVLRLSRGEISSFYLPTDSGIGPAQRFRGSHALERCRRTFKHSTVQIILISWISGLCFCKLSFMETRQNRFLCMFSTLQGTSSVFNHRCSQLPGHMRLSQAPWAFFNRWLRLCFWLWLLYTSRRSLRRYLPSFPLCLFFSGLKTEQRTFTFTRLFVCFLKRLSHQIRELQCRKLTKIIY